MLLLHYQTHPVLLQLQVGAVCIWRAGLRAVGRCAWHALLAQHRHVHIQQAVADLCRGRRQSKQRQKIEYDGVSRAAAAAADGEFTLACPCSSAEACQHAQELRAARAATLTNSDCSVIVAQLQRLLPALLRLATATALTPVPCFTAHTITARHCSPRHYAGSANDVLHIDMQHKASCRSCCCCWC